MRPKWRGDAIFASRIGPSLDTCRNLVMQSKGGREGRQISMGGRGRRRNVKAEHMGAGGAMEKCSPAPPAPALYRTPFKTGFHAPPRGAIVRTPSRIRPRRFQAWGRNGPPRGRSRAENPSARSVRASPLPAPAPPAPAAAPPPAPGYPKEPASKAGDQKRARTSIPLTPAGLPRAFDSRPTYLPTELAPRGIV